MLIHALAAVLALSPVQAYNQGNRLYAGRDYSGAAVAYREALRAGPSARAYYNLGNALFKSGKIGEAIVAYRRAQLLDPRDADTAANLAFARTYRVDKVLAAPGPLARALDQGFHWLSQREAALLAAGLCALAGLAFALWIVRRGPALAAAAALLAALALFCFVTERVWAGEQSPPPAVVVVAEAGAWSGPSQEFKQILALHDGAEVRIREARGVYVLVQLPGGSGGWVAKGSIERVF